MEERNWVKDVGGLPAFIKDVVDELKKNGHDESSAIAIAVSRCKVWAAKGNAKAAAALAEWEAKRAKARADTKRGSSMTYEIRETGGNVTPEGDPDKRMFAARVINYNKVDDHGTTFAPGAFRESLEKKMPKAVWSHDKNRPIGKVVDYRDSEDGLDVIVQLADLNAVPDARMAHAVLKDDIIDEFSFAFSRETDEADPNHRGATRITKAIMYEVSPVLVASGQGTRTYAVRSSTRAEASELLNQVALGEISAADALEQLAETRDSVTIPVAEYRSLLDKAGIKPEEAETFDTAAETRAIDSLFSEEW